MNYPTPLELADYLKEPGRKKALHQFANTTGGRCCLGHYADMCGMDYPPEQSVFVRPPMTVWVALPPYHWLYNVQIRLANANDNTPGFAAVIAILEGLDA